MIIMTRYTVLKLLYFALLWISISATDLKQQEDASESVDIDFSFLEGDAKHENWVDPFNMFEYKPSTGNLKMVDAKDSGKVKDKTKISKEEDVEVSEDTVTKKFHEQFACDRNKNEMPDCRDDDFESEVFDANVKPETNSCKDEEFIYLKRTANMILNKISDLKGDSPSSALHIILTITEDAITTLKAFLGSPCKHVQDFDSVVAVTLDNAELTNSYSYIESIYSYLYQFFQSERVVYYVPVFLAVIILWGQLLRLSIPQIIPRLIIFIYFLSFAWNWVLLLKMETASAYANAEKTSPSECRNDDKGVLKKISLILDNIFFSSSDKCKQYYEAVLVEPIWKVSPLVVLSKTTSDLFFHPLGYLGQHLGYFFQNLLSSVSWYLLLPVCVIVTISILLFLLMMFGYRIRLFPYLCVEPGGHQYTREQNQLISDVLKGRVQIQRTASIQSISTNESIAHSSNCSGVNNIDQKAIKQKIKKTSSNEEKGTQTAIIEPNSLSSMCYDKLVNSKVNGKIQELEIEP